MSATRAGTSPRLGPGALAERLASIPLRIEGHRVETGSYPAVGYYGGEPRPTGVVTLAGGGFEGRGENVAWDPEDQRVFAEACDPLVPTGRTTVGELSGSLLDAAAEPYHRAAIEGAAIDLALAQSDSNLFRLSGSEPRPVSFCWSIHEKDDPVRAVEDLLSLCPTARIKIDVPEDGWPERVWEALAATERIVVLDFKRRSVPLDGVFRAHRHLPAAWLEDPPLEARSATTDGGWTSRVSLDGYVEAAADLERPPLPVAAVNVKASRVGGWLEALRILEVCRRRGWDAYFGGMFEVVVGRRQARILASLFTTDSWNDLAPIREGEGAELAATPLEISNDSPGFG